MTRGAPFCVRVLRASRASSPRPLSHRRVACKLQIPRRRLESPIPSTPCPEIADPSGPVISLISALFWALFPPLLWPLLLACIFPVLRLFRTFLESATEAAAPKQ